MVAITVKSLIYTNFSRQLNCWSLRCNWSITCRRCSNYIFILHTTLGFNLLRKDNCKPRRETFKIWDLVSLILEIYGRHAIDILKEENSRVDISKFSSDPTASVHLLPFICVTINTHLSATPFDIIMYISLMLVVTHLQHVQKLATVRTVYTVTTNKQPVSLRAKFHRYNLTS